MDKEEYNTKISKLTEEALDSNIKLIDIIAVLESAKMTMQIIMHESARREKII